MYEAIGRKLATGELVIIDGGTGTHIQRLGAPMDDEVWCAAANLNSPDIVRQAHADYVMAGAEVITANTYASSPVLFEALGRSDEIPGIDRAAIKLAREAVSAHATGPIAIAGSISPMRLVKKGGDRTEQPDIPHARALELMKMKADGLAEAGCDLIIMEMLRDTDYSLWATEAAVATGLPVWVGISVERRDDGQLAGFDDYRWTLKDLVSVLMATGAQACRRTAAKSTAVTSSRRSRRSRRSGPVLSAPIRSPASSRCRTGSSATSNPRTLPSGPRPGDARAPASSAAAVASARNISARSKSAFRNV